MYYSRVREPMYQTWESNLAVIGDSETEEEIVRLMGWQEEYRRHGQIGRAKALDDRIRWLEEMLEED